MDTIIIIAALGFIIAIAIMIFVTRKSKPQPPSPTPQPTVTPIPQGYFYGVTIREVGNCKPLKTGYIFNSTNLDNEIGKFYYYPDQNIIFEIMGPEQGDPAYTTNFSWPGSEECSEISMY